MYAYTSMANRKDSLTQFDLIDQRLVYTKNMKENIVKNISFFVACGYCDVIHLLSFSYDTYGVKILRNLKK